MGFRPQQITSKYIFKTSELCEQLLKTSWTAQAISQITCIQTLREVFFSWKTDPQAQLTVWYSSSSKVPSFTRVWGDERTASQTDLIAFTFICWLDENKLLALLHTHKHTHIHTWKLLSPTTVCAPSLPCHTFWPAGWICHDLSVLTERQTL